MKVDDFSNEIKFNVGQRVRYIDKDISKRDINCNTGIITKVFAKFAQTHHMRKIEYHIVFDRPLIKKEKVIIIQIYELTVREDSLELEKIDGDEGYRNGKERRKRI